VRFAGMSVPSTGARAALGRVGVWYTGLGLRSAEDERTAAASIEELGYPALWFGEGTSNKEAFSHAAILLAATREIVIATGIASIYSRDATAMKCGGLALAEAYPGRFVLGIGVSHAPMVELRGHDYGKPVAAMRDYLDAMERARYSAPEPVEPLLVVLAALRPRMLELARDRSDGAHPYLVTPRHTVRARELLGPDRLLAPEQGFVLESDPDRARAIAREHLGTYLTLPNYVNSWREEGFGDADFADGGSDRLVDGLVVWGDADAIAERVREHLDGGADHVCLQPVARPLAEAVADLRALAPSVLSL
jgi:probable F420-dependent oxidoreductase